MRTTTGALLRSENQGPAILGMVMLYKLGRVLQLLGLVILPVAIAGNVADPERMDLRSSLTLSAVGVGVFIVGWLLQQSGKK